MWSTAWILSQNAATLRSARSTWRSSFRTRAIPTICIGSALLARPVEEWPDDALPLTREQAPCRIAFAEVLHVERDGIAHHRPREQLHPRERDDACLDRRQTLVEQVARDPGRRDVGSRRRRLTPAVARVHRVERHVPVGAEDLDLREDRQIRVP